MIELTQKSSEVMVNWISGNSSLLEALNQSPHQIVIKQKLQSQTNYTIGLLLHLLRLLFVMEISLSDTAAKLELLVYILTQFFTSLLVF